MFLIAGISSAASYLILSFLKRKYLNREQRRSLGKLQARGGEEFKELEASHILLQCIRDIGVGY